MIRARRPLSYVFSCIEQRSIVCAALYFLSEFISSFAQRYIFFPNSYIYIIMVTTQKKKQDNRQRQKKTKTKTKTRNTYMVTN
jgi:hypothetical protein